MIQKKKLIRTPIKKLTADQSATCYVDFKFKHVPINVLAIRYDVAEAVVTRMINKVDRYLFDHQSSKTGQTKQVKYRAMVRSYMHTSGLVNEWLEMKDQFDDS